MATAVVRTPRSTGSGSPTSPARNWLADVSRTKQPQPSAIIFYGPPGIGKTSLAAAIPGVAILVERQEMGVHQLKDSNLIPSDVPVLPAVETWADTLDVLEALRTGEHDFKALALDAMAGFESLCHAEVCRRDYKNEMNERGFLSYSKGYVTSLTDWRIFLNALDRLRFERKMSILLLGHSKVVNFKNPEGPDYDRYCVDVNKETWAVTHKWADMVLFANFDVAVTGDGEKKKAKARGGKTRSIYTEYDAAFEAKNRHNLPPVIDMGGSGQEAWANLVNAIKEGRKAGKVGE